MTAGRPRAIHREEPGYNMLPGFRQPGVERALLGGKRGLVRLSRRELGTQEDADHAEDRVEPDDPRG